MWADVDDEDDDDYDDDDVCGGHAHDACFLLG